MLRRLALGCALASLALAAAAAAQVRSVAVTSIAGPISLRGAVGGSDELSCSQSFQTTDRTASTSLAIDRRADARIVVELRTVIRSGSSRFAMGPHEAVETTRLARVELSGRAQRTPQGITIAIERAARAEATYSGAPAFDASLLPAATSTVRRMAATLTCAIERVGVLPAIRTEHESATDTPLLACRTTGPFPAGLDELGIERLLFGAGPGVLERNDEDPWSRLPVRSVRARP